MTRTLASVGGLTLRGESEFVLMVDEGHHRLLGQRHQQRILEALNNAGYHCDAVSGNWRAG